jgi:hypothetical protein
MPHTFVPHCCGTPLVDLATEAFAKKYASEVFSTHPRIYRRFNRCSSVATATLMKVPLVVDSPTPGYLHGRDEVVSECFGDIDVCRPEFLVRGY